MKKTFFSLMAFAVLFCLALTGAPRCLAQKPAEAPLKWFDPLEAGPVVHGVGWDELRSGYVRLPEKAHGVVRNEVWGLSRNAAGLSLVFESDASEILVIYGVEGTPGMFHMPGTGKSGVDLYATDRDGKVRWVAPDFPPSFRDTIRYIYSNITYHPEGATQYEYHLYLPLYNTITWLKIGIPQEAQIRFLPESAEKPLVVYGTSIGQGACASRAGNCWTGIVERETGIPLINLAFSGNGRLEPEVLELLAEIDARAYILDCTPNLTHAKDIEPRLLEAVRILRAKRDCPILIVEHSGNVGVDASDAKGAFREANVQVRSAFKTLKKQGWKKIYYMSQKELGLPMDGMVEGVHPNDLGMRYIANGYEKKLRAMGIRKEKTN